VVIVLLLTNKVRFYLKTISKWWTAAILKIDISPYLTEKSSDFDEILYTAADFELDERHVIKNEKVVLDRLRVRQNAFLVCLTLASFHQRSTSTVGLSVNQRWSFWRLNHDRKRAAYRLIARACRQLVCYID